MSEETTNDNQSNDNFKPEVPKASFLWLKDTSGYPSVSVTFATVAFWITTISYLLSIVERIGTIEIRAFDATACSSYMIPILSLYFGRRWTDAKFSLAAKNNNT